MNIIKGEIFSFSKENPPIDELTISMAIMPQVKVFSLGKKTDISKESYPNPTLLYVLLGSGVISSKEVHQGDVLFLEENEMAKKETDDGILYVEFQFTKEKTRMTELIKPGNLFQLKEMLPYQKGKIINLDIFHSEKSKLSLISMSEGCALDQHQAPGEALLFVLDGKATLTYEGKDYLLQSGDNFAFAKGGLHAIYADTDFKFALFLEL